MNGGECVISVLEEAGAEVVFGMPGVQTGPLYSALNQSKKIRHVLVRDVRNAIYAADAFARCTGKIGICDATMGIGAAKLASGLIEATNSSIPILALIGSHETYYSNYVARGRLVSGTPQREMLRPLCKELFTITSRETIAETLWLAIATACSGVPGPVVVEMPVDIMLQPRPEGADLHPTRIRPAVFPIYRSNASQEALGRAAELLYKAKRPLIVAGGGVMISGAEQILTRIAEEFSIPVVHTFSGKGCIPSDHPMSMGFCGLNGIPMNESFVNTADLVFMIGAKSGQNATFNWKFPNKHQKLIRLDVDPTEMEGFFQADVCLLGDARTSLESLYPLLKERGVVERPQWQENIRLIRASWNELKQAEKNFDVEPIFPQRIIKSIQPHYDRGSCIVSDASFSSYWLASFLEQNDCGRRSFYPRGAAGLGWSLPAAIGIAESKRFEKIFVFSGDGGLMYSLSEFATIKQHGYPIICIVLNNHVLGWWKIVGGLQQDTMDNDFNLGFVDFAAIGRGFGLPAVTVKNPEQLDVSLARMVDNGGGIINVLTGDNTAPIVGHRNGIVRPD